MKTAEFFINDHSYGFFVSQSSTFQFGPGFPPTPAPGSRKREGNRNHFFVNRHRTKTSEKQRPLHVKEETMFPRLLVLWFMVLIYLLMCTATVVSEESAAEIDSTGEVTMEDTETMLEYARIHMREESEKKNIIVAEEKEKQKKKEDCRSARGICVDCFSYNGKLSVWLSPTNQATLTLLGCFRFFTLIPIFFLMPGHVMMCTINEFSCQAVNHLNTYVSVDGQDDTTNHLLVITPLVTFVLTTLAVMFYHTIPEIKFQNKTFWFVGALSSFCLGKQGFFLSGSWGLCMRWPLLLESVVTVLVILVTLITLPMICSMIDSLISCERGVTSLRPSICKRFCEMFCCVGALSSFCLFKRDLLMSDFSMGWFLSLELVCSFLLVYYSRR